MIPERRDADSFQNDIPRNDKVVFRRCHVRDNLQEKRHEDDAAEHGDRGQDIDQAGDQEDAIGEEARRQDRLARAALLDDAEGEEDQRGETERDDRRRIPRRRRAT